MGPIISISALLCWLELGLSIPKFDLTAFGSREYPSENPKNMENVPRSGGEKNYVSVSSLYISTQANRTRP